MCTRKRRRRGENGREKVELEKRISFLFFPEPANREETNANVISRNSYTQCYPFLIVRRHCSPRRKAAAYVEHIYVYGYTTLGTATELEGWKKKRCRLTSHWNICGSIFLTRSASIKKTEKWDEQTGKQPKKIAQQ